jgi:hypothetical protein
MDGLVVCMKERHECEVLQYPWLIWQVRQTLPKPFRHIVAVIATSLLSQGRDSHTRFANDIW